MNHFLKQCAREWLLYCRQPRLLINGFIFFVLVMVFFPLTLPADSRFLTEAAPGLIWIALLLAVLLSSEQLFQQDFEMGVLEQWTISAQSLTLCIYAKLFIHWLLTLIPMVLLIPLLTLLFHFPNKALLALMATLLFGSPTLIGLSAFAAAISLSLEQKGTFMAVILFCLAIPILMLGSMSFQASLQNLPISAYLSILLAISLISIAFLPLAISAVIRLKVGE